MSDPFDPFIEETPTPAFTGSPPGYESEETLMDPAHQSLAEALNITFKLLVVVMLVLVALFVMSGFRQVKESQRGIKVTLGRVVESDVAPGWTFVAPFPVGELILIETGTKQLEIKEEFGPAAQLGQSIESATKSMHTLNPEDSSSVVTADLNIAHTWWGVVWTRNDVEANKQNIHEEFEDEIVRTAVERGVVHAMANITIDQLLKQGVAGAAGGSGESSITVNVRNRAQETLDALKAGIRIESISLIGKSPPGRLKEDFARVTKAEAGAAKSLEDAQKEARTQLNATAGDAHAALLALIDEYGQAIELEEEDRAEQLLATIDTVLEGEPYEFEGRTVVVAGRVTDVIESAKSYRTNVVASARAREESFLTKLAQFRALEPAVYVAREWSPAFRDFRFNGGVEVVLVPRGTDPVQIVLSSDPDISKELEQARNRGEISESMERSYGAVDQAYRDRGDAERMRDREKRRRQNSGG